MQGDPLCRFDFKPGQFVNVSLEIAGRKVVRSYSISSSPTRPYTMEITVKRVPGGLVSNWMHDQLKVGDRLNLKGPKGSFCLEPTQIPHKILLVGAGSGITPVMAIARWLCDVAAPVDLRLYYSIKSEYDFVFGAELEMMIARHPQFTGHLISATRDVGAGWKGARGRLDEQALRSVVPDLHERVIYMCGPEPFMDATKSLLQSLKFNMSQLHMESFGATRATRSYSIPPPGEGKPPTSCSRSPGAPCGATVGYRSSTSPRRPGWRSAMVAALEVAENARSRCSLARSKARTTTDSTRPIEQRASCSAASLAPRVTAKSMRSILAVVARQAGAR